MTDPTVSIRRRMLADINARPGTREYLEPQPPPWSSRGCRWRIISPPERWAGAAVEIAVPGDTSGVEVES
jgi:hypothetical protein